MKTMLSSIFFFFIYFYLSSIFGIEISITPSRISGVAPLSVAFDAVDTTDESTTRPFHDLDYTWDFGDPNSGTWVVSGKSKNKAKGAVSSHVFEEPGTYIVTLTVKDSLGEIAIDNSITITVNDPDVVYAGSNTICISSSGNFTGAPSGALQITSSDISGVIQSNLANNRRILLRRGDSWTATLNVQISNIAGPMTIGAFGEGIDQDERGIYSNAPIINFIYSSAAAFFRLTRCSDIRFMDLHLIGRTDVSHLGASGGDIDLTMLLYQRLKIDGFSVGIGFSHWDPDLDGHVHDGLTLYNCDVSNGNDYQLYIGSEKLALLGNSFKDSSITHVVRIWQAYKGVISHNSISGSSINSSSGRHALKFHGPSEAQIMSTSGDRLAFRTQFVVINDNIFGSSGPWPIAIGPQDGGQDERLNDIIIENNRLIPAYGTQSTGGSPPVSVAMSIWARNVTIRNNIFDGIGSGNDYTGIYIGARGIEPPPINIHVYNNTIYKNDVASGGIWAGVQIKDNFVNDTIIRNNYVYFGGSAVKFLVRGTGTSTTQDHNLLLESPADHSLVDPDNPDLLLRNYRPVSTSTVIDGGTTVPVYEDFAGNLRSLGTAYDIGAYEFLDLPPTILHVLDEIRIHKFDPGAANVKTRIREYYE